jgi:hypothetical protein
MHGEKAERWAELCAQAAVEQDPTMLMRLISEINQLLEEREQRLKARAGASDSDQQSAST